ncbi:unnamed protein product [Umbelopsis ramanniana]
MTAFNGSARLARASIVNNEFRLESINIYTSETNITSVASVNLTFTGVWMEWTNFEQLCARRVRREGQHQHGNRNRLSSSSSHINLANV